MWRAAGAFATAPRSGVRDGWRGTEPLRDCVPIDSQHFSQEHSQQHSQEKKFHVFLWGRHRATHRTTHSNTHRTTHSNTHRPSSQHLFCQGEGRGFESRRPLQRKSRSRPCEGLKSAPRGAARGAVHHICTTFAELFPPIAAGEPLSSRVRVTAPSWLACVGQASPGRPVGYRRGRSLELGSRNCPTQLWSLVTHSAYGRWRPMTTRTDLGHLCRQGCDE